MTALTNRTRAGGFLQSESNFARSRDQITIEGGSGGAGAIYAGTVLGKITATGKYIASVYTASDGSQTPVAVLWEDVDATAADVVAGALTRAAEVRKDDLTIDSSWASHLATLYADLANVGIIVRLTGGVQISSTVLQSY